jgi:hypothetical protein
LRKVIESDPFEDERLLSESSYAAQGYAFIPLSLPSPARGEGFKSAFRQGTGMERYFGDWGEYRVRLYPTKETDTCGRTNFFLHGGEKPGSAGCIDIGNADRDLFPLLLVCTRPIT